MAKRRRYLISAAVLAVCVAAALAMLAMVPPPVQITRESHLRIKTGMNKADVFSIIGCEPHFHPGEANKATNRFTGDQATIEFETKSYVWDAPACSIFVIFNDEQTVVNAVSVSRQLPESRFEQFRRWLGLQR